MSAEAGPLRFVRGDFQDLEEYVPVKPLDVLAREIGVPAGQLVKLDANENLYGVIPEVREAIASAPLHIYPDPGQGALREAIAEYAGVTPGQVVAGAGADDLIDVIIRLAGPGTIVTATPTFGMYGFLAKIAGARVVESPRGANFEPGLAAIERAVDGGARVVFLASPNNPTGNLLSRAEVERLCRMDALVVIDEAYIEFSGDSAAPLLDEHSNLVILRTFSKWAGLAGLRVGYSLSHPDLARLMMGIKQPYNVSVAADAAARAALEHRAQIFETVRCIVAERERMAGLVGALGWMTPLPSCANFVLFEVKGRSAAGVAASLRRRGVLVRYYDRPDLQNYIRISAGRPEDTDRLLAALRAVEAE
ncbi:MAG: histidinol-phosphate transaminase [Dehalococcoidia bacterium]|nr:histidinol-phosphate transaminase [Chloroflexi bacterium CFX7]MCK6564879.1 histidinol-phosphate transaminase [Dehalococcoidia bacterium]NUQ54281.1 histidinol-phosphate transaminase [Dehalococcoidia bacterium]RIL04263.1 MAG: histidinol-phosphate transaminase [bacterium]